jgi:hypothetical protein
MAQDIEYTTIMADTDKTEGRGHLVPVAHFKNPGDARTVCEDARFYKQHGVMGTPMNPGTYVRKTTIRVYDSVEEFWECHDEDTARAKALAKLTDEDKKVLGLI